MGKPDIIEKIRKEFIKADGISEECQVVYVLSRIRKVLDKDGSKKYKHLRFYCNWALHTEIDRTEKVQEMLLEFITEKNKSRFLNFAPLLIDLKEFSREYRLSEAASWLADPINVSKFQELLVAIYSDTPVKVSCGLGYEITISDPKQEDPESPLYIAWKTEPYGDIDRVEGLLGDRKTP